MAVIDNLDQLFDFPHFSAVSNRAKQSHLNNKKYFNSGLLVIEPNKNDFEDIKKFVIPTINEFKKRNQSCGDQNVLNRYFINWPKKRNLHLSEIYNVFWGSIDDYIKNRGYSLFDSPKIKIIHFTGKHKPWQNKYWYFIKSILRPIKNHYFFPSKESLKFIIKYFNSLDRIEDKLKGM